MNCEGVAFQALFASYKRRQILKGLMKAEEIPPLSGFLSPQRQAGSDLESRSLMLFLEEDKLRHKESQDGWRGELDWILLDHYSRRRRGMRVFS